MKISVCVILFRTKYLDEMISSLLSQSHKDLELLLVDQEEGVWSAFEYCKEKFPEVSVIKGDNLWHSGGMNKLADMATGDLIVIGSNDFYYSRDFFEKIANQVSDSNSDVFVPVLKRWDYPNEFTNYIDCVGINFDKKFAFHEVLSGCEYNQELIPDFVDGPNGALAIFTRKAYEKLIEKDGYLFDENIHYKNDCDLTFRLKKHGLKTKVLKDCFAYHDRQQVFYKKKSKGLRESSFYGDLWLLKKHFRFNFEFFNPLLTLMYYTCKLSYLLMRYPYLWKQMLRK